MTWWKLQCMLQSERANLKSHHTQGSSSMTFCKRQTMAIVKRSVGQGLRGEGWKHRVQRIFRDGKLLCMISQWCMHLPKPIECTVPRVSRKVDYSLWGDSDPSMRHHQLQQMDRPCWGLLIVGEAVHIYRQRAYGKEGLCPSTQSCWELKTVLKIEYIFF